MLSTETQKELGMVRDFSSHASLVEKNGSSFKVTSDWEGPFVLGDPLAVLMQSRVSSSLFADGYAAYNWAKDERGFPSNLAQEGVDTGFPLLWFLSKGIIEDDLSELAAKSRIMPGANELSGLIRTNGSLIVVTSAPFFMYDSITKQVPVDKMIGTEFPISAMDAALKNYGQWDKEVGFVDDFLEEYSEKVSKRPLKKSLNRWIWEEFFEGKLGVSYDPEVRSSRGNSHQTILGQYLESNAIVGDFSKREIAKNSTLTMGDGENDALMLKEGTFSIAINASTTAVKAAKIGVISENLSPVISIVKFILSEPDATVDQVVREIQKGYDEERALIHIAGADTSDSILQSHLKQKRINRDPLSTY